MNQPTAPVEKLQPRLYPQLPEDVQNNRLQQISDIEQKLIEEKNIRQSLYKMYKRVINIMDGIDTAIISSSVVTGSIGVFLPIMLPLIIVALSCGTLGVCAKFFRRRIFEKAKMCRKRKAQALGAIKKNK